MMSGTGSGGEEEDIVIDNRTISQKSEREKKNMKVENEEEKENNNCMTPLPPPTKLVFSHHEREEKKKKIAKARKESDILQAPLPNLLFPHLVRLQLGPECGIFRLQRCLLPGKICRRRWVRVTCLLVLFGSG